MKRILVFGLSLLLISSCANKKQNELPDKQSEVNINKNQKEEIIGIGTVTSIVDGYDVQVVNLWSSVNADRTIVERMYSGDAVKVLKFEDPYYYIEYSKSNKRGYCMSGYIVLKGEKII